MLSKADLVAKRAALRWLAQQHPQWTHQDLADALAMSHSWSASGSSGYAKPFLLMFWLCIPAHGRGTPHRPPSPPNPPSCNAFWRFEPPHLRTCSASLGWKRSCTTCIATLPSNTPVCVCRVPRRPSGRFCARWAASRRTVGASPGP